MWQHNLRLMIAHFKHTRSRMASLLFNDSGFTSYCARCARDNFGLHRHRDDLVHLGAAVAEVEAKRCQFSSTAQTLYMIQRK
jgi:hypothetical protein